MYLVFDIGATNMRLATSTDGKTINEPRIVKTPGSFDEGMKLFEEVANQLTQSEKIIATAGGIAGPLNKEKSAFFINQVIPEWNQKPLKEELERITKAPVFLENDAALGALGESVFGAGTDADIVAFLTISTGIGGARIVKKQIDQNALGFEPGYQIINGGKDLQQLISGFSLERKYDKKPEDIHDALVWSQVEKDLAIALNNITVIWSPDIIVLGGSLMKSINIENVEQNLKAILQVFPQPPKLAKATLGDKSGLYGALSLITNN